VSKSIDPLSRCFDEKHPRFPHANTSTATCTAAPRPSTSSRRSQQRRRDRFPGIRSLASAYARIRRPCTSRSRGGWLPSTSCSDRSARRRWRPPSPRGSPPPPPPPPPTAEDDDDGAPHAATCPTAPRKARSFPAVLHFAHGPVGSGHLPGHSLWSPNTNVGTPRADASFTMPEYLSRKAFAPRKYVPMSLHTIIYSVLFQFKNQQITDGVSEGIARGGGRRVKSRA